MEDDMGPLRYPDAECTGSLRKYIKTEELSASLIIPSGETTRGGSGAGLQQCEDTHRDAIIPVGSKGEKDSSAGQCVQMQGAVGSKYDQVACTFPPVHVGGNFGDGLLL